ncbi:DUF3223 domain-containing protein [Arthrobacter crusticola]|uniref:DUF3223 domain-containing protein n=1 Tax=Arthrobacter crusticola TaxID=2547960 RepID=A0A4R5TXE3_9MICC|nr:DUF3223 domain-containing protein [Arthrobacter crusticola]TDK25847.1 DUF3223 domain-containing protein [Arthrobacter crusticola]
MEYQVGEYHFSRKGQVKEILSKELGRLEVGEEVADTYVSGLLTALAREHPEAEDKIGKGIEHWVVCSNRDLGYASNGFRAKQTGREGLIPFSYSDVLSPPRQRARVAEALTFEAIDITRQFRTDAFREGPVRCADTGEVLIVKTLADAVHREPPRGQLHRMFLASEGLSYDTTELVKHPSESGYRLVDRALAQRWRSFQAAHLEGMAIVKRRASSSR